MVRAADMTHLPPGIRFPEGREPTQVEMLLFWARRDLREECRRLLQATPRRRRRGLRRELEKLVQQTMDDLVVTLQQDPDADVVWRGCICP